MNGIHEVTGSIPVWSTNLPYDSRATLLRRHRTRGDSRGVFEASAIT